MLETSKMTAPIRLNIAVVYCIHKYKVENVCQSGIIYISITDSTGYLAKRQDIRPHR
jgi:hypothetical protein